ncbi:MAG: serine/threonine-protein kinase, partial [Thiohalobacterales bacterium]|nr:serine/threonine-protein kinase [Thiohalobacterales bacterium]
MTIKIPGYKIIKPIAEGGMAAVYLAEQQSLGRRVVLKLLKKFDDVYQSARFVTEGRIIASLNHRNIITIHDIGVIGERHYIAMEFLEGGDLEMRNLEGMSVDAALDLVETIGDCLDFLHRKNIIHRDIKPANILFHSDGTPVLTDFGVAKQQEADAKLTRDGTTLGSPYYISPEQAECKPVDGRSDIYSLGIVLYEMLTGAKPYQGESDIQVIISHLSDPVPSLPPRLGQYQELIDRMIAKSPADRFATAADLVVYLRELRQDGTQVRTTGRTRPAGTTASNLHGVQPLTAHDTQLSLRSIQTAIHDNSGIFAAGALTLLLVLAIGFSGMKPGFISSALESITGKTGETTHTTHTTQTIQTTSQDTRKTNSSDSAKHAQYLAQAEQAR